MHGRIRLLTALVLANARACQMLVHQKTPWPVWTFLLLVLKKGCPQLPLIRLATRTSGVVFADWAAVTDGGKCVVKSLDNLLSVLLGPVATSCAHPACFANTPSGAEVTSHWGQVRQRHAATRVARVCLFHDSLHAAYIASMDIKTVFGVARPARVANIAGGSTCGVRTDGSLQPILVRVRSLEGRATFESVRRKCRSCAMHTPEKCGSTRASAQIGCAHSVHSGRRMEEESDGHSS